MAIYKCGACGKDIQTSDTNQFVVCPYCGNTNDVRPEATVPTTYKKSNSTPIYILIAAVCVAIVVFIGGIFILYTKDDNNLKDQETIVKSENSVENQESADAKPSNVENTEKQNPTDTEAEEKDTVKKETEKQEAVQPKETKENKESDKGVGIDKSTSHDNETPNTASQLISYCGLSHNMVYEPVQNPQYYTFTDYEYGFSIDVPSHFVEKSSANPNCRYIGTTADGAAALKVCAMKNTENLTIKQVRQQLIDIYGGTVSDSHGKDSWFLISISNNGEERYAYYKLRDGVIRGFEFHFYGSENMEIYSQYIEEIYASLR